MRGRGVAPHQVSNAYSPKRGASVGIDKSREAAREKARAWALSGRYGQGREINHRGTMANIIA